MIKVSLMLPSLNCVIFSPAEVTSLSLLIGILENEKLQAFRGLCNTLHKKYSFCQGRGDYVKVRNSLSPLRYSQVEQRSMNFY